MCAPLWWGVALVAALSLATDGVAAQTARQRGDSVTVVFVCEHGTVKSLVALEYFNSVARARHLPFTAISRGTNPDATVPLAIRAGLNQDGFEVAGFRPQLFAVADAKRSSLVVSFDVNVAARPGTRIERWDNLPSLSGDYRIGRDSIRARVEQLVSRLAKTRPAEP